MELSIPYPGKDDLEGALNVTEACKESSIGFIMSHGASGDLHSGRMPFWAEALAGAGIPAIRYTHKSTSMPARTKSYQAVLAHAKTLPQLQHVKKWVFAGHSMGSRVALEVAKAHPEDALACILFSYPLHPPGKAESLREVPLTELELPILMVRGTKDPFSTQGPFEAVSAKMTSKKFQVHTIEGAAHELKIGGKNGAAATQAALETAAQVVIDFIKAASQPEAGTAEASNAGGASWEAGGEASREAGPESAAGEAAERPEKRKAAAAEAVPEATEEAAGVAADGGSDGAGEEPGAKKAKT